VIIAVDCDGTIFDHRYPDLGEPVPGAFEWMKRWQAAGAKLILWTMRDDGGGDGPVLAHAVEACRRHGVEFWGVNENPEQASWSGSRKCYANLYVDDAAVGCPLLRNRRMGGRDMVDWSVVGPHVQEYLDALAAKKGGAT
jgi:hypothetical protein